VVIRPVPAAGLKPNAIKTGGKGEGDSKAGKGRGGRGERVDM